MPFFILFKKDKGKRKINATFFWHCMVFLAALVAVITLALEFFYELTIIEYSSAFNSCSVCSTKTIHNISVGEQKYESEASEKNRFRKNR